MSKDQAPKSQTASRNQDQKRLGFEEGGGAGKWLLGAAAAAIVLLGGGYAAWQTLGPPDRAQSEIAYNDQDSDAFYADDLDASDDRLAEPAANETAAPAAARSTPAPRQTARADIPEQTIGVASADAAADFEEDAIIVPGARRPVWASTPSPRRLSALYPARALDRGREGEARLHCIVQERGRLDCERLEATPGGFGTAAVRVANRFRHAETLADGSSAIGTPVNLRVIFRIEDDRRRG